MKGRTNLWTQEPVKEHQMDVQTIEELFGHNDCQSNSKALSTRGGRSRTSFRETKEEVCILDGKRGMNIGIFLKQFKRSNPLIVEDIRSGNSEHYGAEPLREMLKLLPESDEVKKLKAFRGDVSKLSLADSFFYLLIQLPSYVVRIESMLLKEEFPGECEAMKQNIKTLRSATEELMSCEELHAVLHLVLQAGNILNAGGYAGNAVGFKLSSLPSLADTKANKPGMNLLHFVALEAQKKDEKLLEFPLKLNHVQAASRISLEVLDSDLQRLVYRTKSVEESVQRDTELLQQLDAFLQSATAALCSLRGSRQQLKREAEELLDFFCEDKDAFKLDDCFNIFNSFCIKFTSAVKDNAERERKEVARQRRLQELEEQKRHSWAGGEQVLGAFGLRSSSELDMSTALSRNDEAGLLMELLMPKSHPRSPLLRRSGSFRRSRNLESEARTSEQKQDESLSLKVPTHYLNNEIETQTSTATSPNTSSDLNNNGQVKTRANTGLNNDFCSIEKSAGTMSVTLEKCTLVPELKAFDKVSVPTKSKSQNDVVVADLEEREANDAKNIDKTASVVKTEQESQDKVIVWCVTGVCEVEIGQNDNQPDNMTISSCSANDAPSNQQNQNSVPEPISSQPVSRLVDLTTAAYEIKTDSQNEDEVVATKENVEIEGYMAIEMAEKVLDEVDDVKVSQNAKSSNNHKAESLPKKVASPKTATITMSKSVRTLTTTESMNMRRVVPISRPTSAKTSDKPSTNQRGMSALSVPGRSTPRRGERPSTAPSSRRSSFNKMDEQDKKALGKKVAEKKKTPQEEKICRSTLRSLNQNEAKGIVSAPVTPVHKAATPGFARNTASSSFRRSNTTLAKPQNSVNNSGSSLHNAGASSPKIASAKISSPRLSPSSNSASPNTPSPTRNSASNLPPVQNTTHKTAKNVAVPSSSTKTQNSLKNFANLSSTHSPANATNSDLTDETFKNANLDTKSSNLTTDNLLNNNLASIHYLANQTSTNSNLSSQKVPLTVGPQISAANNISDISLVADSTNSNIACPEMANGKRSPPVLQNLTNNNFSTTQDDSALSQHADLNKKSPKSPKMSSPNFNFKTAPRILSPRASSRSTSSEISTNSSLMQIISPKMTSPSLSRAGSFRVSSSSKTPEVNLKKSPSIKIPLSPRLPIRESTAPSGGRTRIDSFSDKTARDSKPNWR